MDGEFEEDEQRGADEHLQLPARSVTLAVASASEWVRVAARSQTFKKQFAERECNFKIHLH